MPLSFRSDEMYTSIAPPPLRVLFSSSEPAMECFASKKELSIATLLHFFGDFLLLFL